jgi:hypothetical protein
MRHEHQMFIGFGSIIVLLYGLIAKDLLNKNRLALSFAISVSILILVTLNIGDFSLYHLLCILPGFSAVRAVSRIILVLLFPIGFIIGYVIDTIALKDFKYISSSAILGIICIISDSILANKPTTSAIDWNNRLKLLESRIVKPIEKDSILAVAAQAPRFSNDIDAMLFAQSKGIKTLNGYSAFWPPGCIHMKTCDDVDQVIAATDKFTMTYFPKGPKLDRSKLISVGFERDCQ